MLVVLLFYLFLTLVDGKNILLPSSLNKSPPPRYFNSSSQLQAVAVNKKSHWEIGLKNGLASGLAAAVVKAILQPFDTIKTVQQGQKGNIGPITAGLSIIKTRGIGGLWSGIGITVIGSSPSVAVYFGVYSSLKKKLTKVFPPNMKLVAVACSAAIGNTLASVLRVPYEVIKQRIQMNQYDSTWECIRASWRTEGAFGLFDKGKLTSQILRDVPYAVVTLMTYELLQTLFIKYSDELSRRQLQEQTSADDNSMSRTRSFSAFLLQFCKLKDALCGALAGGLGTLATTPMDVVKTRMMTGTQYSSVMDATFRIFKEEGILTFLVGTTPRLLHKIPANGLFFLCYEAFKTVLGVPSSDADN